MSITISGKTLRTEGWLTMVLKDSEKPLVLQGLSPVPVAAPLAAGVPAAVVATAVELPPTVAGVLSPPEGMVIMPVFIAALAVAMVVLLQFGGSDRHVQDVFVGLEHFVAHLQGGFESQ